MIRVRQIKIEVTNDNNSNRLKIISKKLGISLTDIKDIKIVRQSLDARNKNNIYYVYDFDVCINNENKVLKKKHSNLIYLSPNEEYIPPKRINNTKDNIIIVGSGPAGLFCGYILAENGYRPIIIERGEKVEDRIKTVEEFWNTGKLNTESNVQFGEGGAGTFSDGKLNTLVNDSNNRKKKVLETFVLCGADNDILYSYKPHIGTDILAIVIKNMRNKIISMGGKFLYSTCLTDIIVKDNEIKGIIVNNKEKIECSNLVLAIGHSSRDTFEMLYKNNINMEAKPFAVGVRVIHNQDMINESQYGKKYKDLLGSASYKLTYKASNNRGVYSFCMCPGGYVVNASSYNNMLAVNGMSYHNRDSKCANSAIIVTVGPKDFGSNPLDGINFQKNLESKAYLLGNGKIPIQLLEDFYNNKVSIKFGNVLPTIKGSYKFSNLNELLPSYISDSIKEAFTSFGTKINGFNNNDTILAGIESRTSSPVRIIRNELYQANIKGIYPCGEGAGYAGGITSASIDGIKVAEKIISKNN